LNESARDARCKTGGRLIEQDQLGVRYQCPSNCWRRSRNTGNSS
jgi:hypothetical protein